MGAWGHDLFQSDHDLDIVSELSGDAGLYEMEKAEKARTKADDSKAEQETYYSIYAALCSDVEVVRKHLDSGVLAKLIKEKEDKLLSPPSMLDFGRDPCYVYVLLGACAMSLGCSLPESYIDMLKKVYTEGGLMPGALKQMKKALFGPDGFQNGVPYNIESKGLLETANSTDDEPAGRGFVGMNVIGPGGFFNTGMGDSTTSPIIKELRDQHNNPNACGGCGAKEGANGMTLLQCSRCKKRKYCSPECQKKQWKMHKKVCQPMKE